MVACQAGTVACSHLFMVQGRLPIHTAVNVKNGIFLALRQSRHSAREGCVIFHLSHDVPHVGIVHGVASNRPRVSVEDVHQVTLLAVLEHQVQLVHLVREPSSPKGNTPRHDKR